MATLNDPKLAKTFELLQHSHRRYVLHYLKGESDGVDFDTLAAAVAASTRAQPGSGPGRTAEDIAIALHHVHLPKLTDYGVVTYDPGTGAVELNDTDSVDRFLEEAVSPGH